MAAAILMPDGTPVVEVDAGDVHEALRALRDQSGFAMLSDLFGIDYLTAGHPPARRFAVVYELLSLDPPRRRRVKVFLPESSPEVPSVTELWPAANWLEREAFDMFGIRFRGHPDLRRLLLPEGYEGHPLRRDYPLAGRGARDAFPRYATETPLGDLLKAASKERLA